MRSLALAITAAGLVGLGTAPARAETLYAVTFDNQLITIDSATGAGTLVGPLSSSMSALGLDFYAGSLYAFDQNADVFRQIDPATGATVGTIDVGIQLFGEGGLAIRADGTGFVAQAFGDPGYNFDLTVPSASPVGGVLPTMDGLTFGPGDVLYGLSQGVTDPSGSSLYTVDPATGNTTLIGSLGIGTSGLLGGLTFGSDGNLYAVVSGGLASPSTLYLVDPTTGAATLIGDVGFNGVSGLSNGPAPAAIPEPASVTLAAAGLAVFSARRLRRGRTA